MLDLNFTHLKEINFNIVKISNYLSVDKNMLSQFTKNTTCVLWWTVFSQLSKKCISSETPEYTWWMPLNLYVNQNSSIPSAMVKW